MPKYRVEVTCTVHHTHVFTVDALYEAQAKYLAEEEANDFEFGDAHVTSVDIATQDVQCVEGGCVHGKGPQDYCQPCGRVNGGKA